MSDGSENTNAKVSPGVGVSADGDSPLSEEEENKMERDINIDNQPEHTSFNIPAEQHSSSLMTLDRNLYPRLPFRSYTHSVCSAKAKIKRHYNGNMAVCTEFDIPKNGDLRSFSTDNMASLLNCLNFSGSTIARVRHKRICGKAFSKMSDEDLQSLGIKNPIVCYFRDRSRSKTLFML